MDVIMPRLSEGMTEGKLLRWCVEVGTRVDEGEVIAEVETDKANMEIESLGKGVVQKFLAHPGDSVPVGQVIAMIEPEQAEPANSPLGEGISFGAAAGSGDPGGAQGVNASPLAIRIAAQRGIDLKQVQGTGPFGRIMKEDVLAFAKNPPPAIISIEPPTPEQPAAVTDEQVDFDAQPAGPDPEEIVPADYVPHEEEPTPDMFPEMDNAVGAGPEPVNMEEADSEKDTLTDAEEQQRIAPPVSDDRDFGSAPTLDLLAPDEAVAETAEEMPAYPGPLSDQQAEQEERKSGAEEPGGKVAATFMAGVPVNLSALKLAVPVLKSRSVARVNLSDDDSALTPIFLKAAALAIAKVKQRAGAVSVAVNVGGAFVYPAVANCAELPLSELFEYYSRMKAAPSAEDDIFGATSELTFINLAAFGVEEFAGLAGDSSATLALGALREQPVSRAGRVERAHVAKATLCANVADWTPEQGLAFLREFRQLVEHPVLLVGL